VRLTGVGTRGKEEEKEREKKKGGEGGGEGEIRPSSHSIALKKEGGKNSGEKSWGGKRGGERKKGAASVHPNPVLGTNQAWPRMKRKEKKTS